MSEATAFALPSSDLNLRERSKNFHSRPVNDTNAIPSNLEIDKEKPSTISTKTLSLRNIILDILGPIILTVLSFYLRFNDIDKNETVVWDEAHFGKFGSYYLKHEFYHDVHPPLGKMLIGLSEWLAGFDGDFGFDSNKRYPSEVNFKFMRQFNATFGALCVPVAFFTAKWMDFDYYTIYLISLMVTLEHSYIALSKFILLDSMLLFFTMTTFACMCKLYSLRNKCLTRQWSMWMSLTGLSIGCVCSVKWVGLFVTLVVGLYTVMELFQFFYDTNLSRSKYYKHWIIRIINLIIVPFLVYLFCFKIHFTLLYKSGTGDSATNTLFQINLEGTTIENSPRNVVYDSEVTLRSHGLSPNLLHSHAQVYPDGSHQRQITGYGFSDTNNNWIIKFARTKMVYFDPERDFISVRDGDEIRLLHKNTNSNLHSHEVPSHVSRGNWEVSGYGSDDVGDQKDDWVVEIVKQMDSANPNFPKEDPEILHPVSTFFRLRHKVLGCYLTSTGLSYPSWGFSQAEIVCKNSWSKHDKSTWWNIEGHWNEHLSIDESYVPPKSNFWTDFVLINFAMASSNNALVPDEDKYDPLASDFWEWPILYRGLRMCNWVTTSYKYYLMGSPFNTWISTLSLFIFCGIVSSIVYKYKRQSLVMSTDLFWKLSIQGGFPFVAWIAHYLPFVVMGRVTYVHHYVPALYFAILVFGFVTHYLLHTRHFLIKLPVYVLLYSGCVYVYILFSPICQGIVGRNANYTNLKWLPSWNIVDDVNFL
ncbi:hypothetical protein KAFR_0G01180 [Kazachstania africana CBS 2517]|uniref:Dolichyl-phosphate-mannose--protein mannosyltransferase n=1 Tax=Kazachstania africana (strain ATCC 22294 / BCRC 22015 / CBS 2517 / CECT 1963 / NBRC 1671 / NRRL Y-8276) TaxID=1071382 RepID=H2AXQ1_KAZAF|nr:hypothetical protein KAFR_0G01180 [Kazachstania africana CBS 2517]CCF59151.1 hypothetical protein KAFR_0G01180 [Kazachstania africana CBS 2517]